MARMESVLVSLSFLFWLLSTTVAASRCQVCTIYRRESVTVPRERQTCTGWWWSRRCYNVPEYYKGYKQVSTTVSCSCITEHSSATVTITPSASSLKPMSISSTTHVKSSQSAFKPDPFILVVGGATVKESSLGASSNSSDSFQFTKPEDNAGMIAGVVLVLLLLLIILAVVIIIVIFFILYKLGKINIRTEKLCCCKSHKAVNNAVVSESSQDQAASKPSSNAYTYVDLNKSAVVYEEVELEGRVSENSTSTIRNPIYSRTSEFANEDINNPLYHIVEPEENQYESPADTLEGEAAGQAVIYEYVPSNAARKGGQKRRAPSTFMTQEGIYSQLNKVDVLENEVEEDSEKFVLPSDNLETLYEELSHRHCIEIPTQVLKCGIVLGSGAFGVVYKGVWQSPRGPIDVALKMAREDAPESEKIKMLQEAAIMKQFNYPFIVKMYGAVTLSDPIILVMEFMENGSLKSVLEVFHQKGSLQEQPDIKPHLISFCCQIASGMHYLSKKQFVHRDLAARNVLVNDRYTCKVSDFGLARDLNEKDYYKVSGGLIPVRWTAPEALMYRKYTTQSDIWSYGMLLIEIWTLGIRPFDMLDNEKVLKLLLNSEAAESDPSLQPCPTGCPSYVYNIMTACWNYNPLERPSFSRIKNLLSRNS